MLAEVFLVLLIVAIIFIVMFCHQNNGVATATKQKKRNNRFTREIAPTSSPTLESFPIVLIHLGSKLPDHVFDCIDQLHVMGWNSVIFLVDTSVVLERLAFCPGVTPVLMPSDNTLSRDISQIHGEKNVFHLSLQRFFTLRDFMEQHSVSRCLHIEHDNLLYISRQTLQNQMINALGNKIGVPRDNKDGRCIASVFYVGSLTSLDQYCQFVAEQEHYKTTDMVSLCKFSDLYPEFCSQLPTLPTSLAENLSDKHGEWVKGLSNSQFSCLFDAACLGQCVGGIDIIHDKGDSRGYISPDSLFSPNDLPIHWMLNDGLRLPLIITDEQVYPLCNLHIHSKNLHLYLSCSAMSPEDIIQGHQFRNLADIQINESSDLSTLSLLQEDNIIFVKTDCLEEFWPVAVNQQKRFTLITHNSDIDITSKFNSYLDHPLLNRWFAQNCLVQHPKAVPLPIGIANSEYGHGDVQTLVEAMKTVVALNPIEQVYVNINASTTPIRRQLMDELKANPDNYVFEENRLTYKEFLNTMKRYQYIACPRGNGADTHRLWESFYLGLIPITYDARYQTTPCIPDYYLPFLDSEMKPWELGDHYDIRRRTNGRIYGRMSYWAYRITHS